MLYYHYAEEHAADDKVPGKVGRYCDGEDDGCEHRTQITYGSPHALSPQEDAERLEDLGRGNGDDDVPDYAEAVGKGERGSRRHQGKGRAAHDEPGALEAVHMRSA